MNTNDTEAVTACLPPPPPDLMGDKLEDQFIVGPWTVLDAKRWAGRRTIWKDCLGLERGFGGEVASSADGSGTDSGKARAGGSGAGVRNEFEEIKRKVGTGGSPMPSTKKGKENERETGGSSFDPVCAEIHYWWFCPAGGQVLDPFAGSCVRGMVAAWRGHPYIGNDLRPEQILLNQTHLTQLPDDAPKPVWTCGDSTIIDEVLGVDLATFDAERDGADYIFSSPPYAGLEWYSDDPRDLNNMSYAGFLAGYREAIRRTCALLKPNRFATFVVGEVRDKTDKTQGGYLGFVPDTIKAFEDAGLRYYNEAILATSIGSVGVTISYSFATQRKLGKVHQNLLTFVKGDPRIAAEACQKGTWTELRAITGECIGKSAAKAVFNPEMVRWASA